MAAEFLVLPSVSVFLGVISLRFGVREAGRRVVFVVCISIFSSDLEWLPEMLGC